MYGRVEPQCIEELNQTVQPWQLTLRQLSSAELQPSITFKSIGDILISNDRWQSHLHGTGGSAADYFTIVGSFRTCRLPWNGQFLQENSLACGASNSEWDFHTPQGSDHWVMMLPEKKLAEHMGVDAEDILDGSTQLLPLEPKCFQRLNGGVKQLLAPENNQSQNERSFQSDEQIETDILSWAAGLFLQHAGGEDGPGVRKRCAAYRRAVHIANRSEQDLGPAELAAKAGVSLRVLQMAFQENLGISPMRYLRLCKLNRLHTILRDSSHSQTNVTNLMRRCGFSEFGRTAGEYRRLFGESPQQTLARQISLNSARILDALSE